MAGLLSFTAMLDMNVVTIAVGDLARELRVPAATAQWAVLGYQLPLVALLLPVGRWLDRAAVRPALGAALAGFALGCGAAALAPSIGWLIAARLMQGACGSVLFVLMPVLAAGAVRPELRGRAMSVPATLGPLGAVAGPAIGGLLLDHLGWRAVFLVVPPVCLAAWLTARRALPSTPPPPRPGRAALGAAAPAAATVTPPHRPARAAFGEAGLVAGAVAAVLLGLTFAAGAPGWALLVLAGIPPAVGWLRRPGGRAVREVLRAGRTAGVHGAVLALGAGFAATHLVLALQLQRDGRHSATATGLVLLCFPLAMGVFGPLGGRLADRFTPRRVAAAGGALTALGLLSLVPLEAGWSLPSIAWRLALAGAGTGLYGGPVQALVMAAAPPGRAATAGAAVQLARSLGFTLGPAPAVALWSHWGPHPALFAAFLATALAAGLLAVPARQPRAVPSPDPRRPADAPLDRA
ncbi:MFS transporter [Kitasatospora sp. MMS16-BH015]|nr:MFS transporter [Kitasatospora sp. MMS16-BH015]